MNSQLRAVSHFIIAGTEKSGTTSVFGYLAHHPQVAPSLRKELDYFRAYRADEPRRLDEYRSLFTAAVGSTRYLMEASPGYLADSRHAAAAITALLPQRKLLFLLREPIGRLESSFWFHRHRFNLPQTLGFDEYVEMCLRYEAGRLPVLPEGVTEWQVRALNAGRYYEHLSDFYGAIPARDIRVCTQDALARDPRGFMQALAGFLEIDGGYFDDFAFYRANVNFSGKNPLLHRLALQVNAALEPVFNRHPAIKRSLLAVYKRVNGAKAARLAMSAATRRALEQYYAPDLERLLRLLDGGARDDVERWLAQSPAAKDTQMQWRGSHAEG